MTPAANDNRIIGRRMLLLRNLNFPLSICLNVSIVIVPMATLMFFKRGFLNMTVLVRSLLKLLALTETQDLSLLDSSSKTFSMLSHQRSKHTCSIQNSSIMFRKAKLNRYTIIINNKHEEIKIIDLTLKYKFQIQSRVQ